MLLAPVGCRRMATDDGWVLFFDRDRLGFVYDVERSWCNVCGEATY